MSGVPPPFSFPSPLHHSSHAEPLAELLLNTASRPITLTFLPAPGSSTSPNQIPATCTLQVFL